MTPKQAVQAVRTSGSSTWMHETDDRPDPRTQVDPEQLAEIREQLAKAKGYRDFKSASTHDRNLIDQEARKGARVQTQAGDPNAA